MLGVGKWDSPSHSISESTWLYSCGDNRRVRSCGRWPRVWATRQSQQVQQVLQVKADTGVMASQSRTLEDRPRLELRRTLASKEGQSAGLPEAAPVGSSFGSMRRDSWFASDTQLSLSRFFSNPQDKLGRGWKLCRWCQVYNCSC